MVTIYYKTIKEQKLQTLGKFRTGSWVAAESPTEDELDMLTSNLPLDRTLLGDAVDPQEVPRVERENGVTYVFTRVPFQEEVQTTTTPFMVAIGKNFILSVSQHPLPFLKKFQEGRVDFNTTQKTKLFLQFFSEVNTTYSSFINNIARRVRGVTVRLERIGNKEIQQFVMFENSLNEFLAALVPTNASLTNLLSGRYLQLYEQDHELVEDLTLSNRQLIELCQSNMRSIGNIREGYSTIMTNELNRVIKLLTALTVILTVPITITALYSMNVQLPFQDSPDAFSVITALILATALSLLAIFVKKRWL